MNISDLHFTPDVLSIDRVQTAESGNCQSVSDPITAAETLLALKQSLAEAGVHVVFSTDFSALAEARLAARNTPVSPMFDAQLCSLQPHEAFWFGGVDDDGKIVCLQAFRLDQVYPNLAEWVSGWMINLYLQRNELVLPKNNHRYSHTRMREVRGPLCYHGEVWIDSRAAKKKVFADFMRLGLLTSHLRWQPAGVWALVGEYMISRGLVAKAGYDHSERGFLNWEWKPPHADEVEWVILADRHNLERIAKGDDIRQT